VQLGPHEEEQVGETDHPDQQHHDRISDVADGAVGTPAARRILLHRLRTSRHDRAHGVAGCLHALLVSLCHVLRTGRCAVRARTSSGRWTTRSTETTWRRATGSTESATGRRSTGSTESPTGWRTGRSAIRSAGRWPT